MPVQEVDSKLLPPLKNSPTKTNWWEKVGGLPDLVTRIAKHLVSERGKTEGTAIATAISQVRKVCASGRTFGGRTAVHPDTKAEYCKAAAEIEAKRAAAKGMSAAKAVAGDFTDEDAATLAFSASVKLGAMAEELGADFIWGAIRERDVSTEARKKLAGKGHAMKDGSFPIANVGDLKNAIRAIGRAPKEKRDAVKALIKRRARALGVTNLMPSNWAVAEEISEEIMTLNAIIEVFGDVDAKVNEGFDERLHPRDRHGRWVKLTGAVEKGTQVLHASTGLKGRVFKDEGSHVIVSHYGAGRERYAKGMLRIKAKKTQEGVIEEAFTIPSLSKLRQTVRANRKADKAKTKSSSSSSGTKHAPAGSPIGGQFISSGASGAVVKGIQKKLGIKTTGTFGSNTKSRIEEFQKNHGLQVDGVIGRQTATALLTGGKKKVGVGKLTTGIKSRLKHRFG